jgi:putative transposase
MKRKRFAVEQIAGILKQAKLGRPIAELCRQHERYYRWKKVYGGMEPSEARDRKQLRDENTKLKRLVADLWLDKVMILAGAGVEALCQRSQFCKAIGAQLYRPEGR